MTLNERRILKDIQTDRQIGVALRSLSSKVKNYIRMIEQNYGKDNASDAAILLGLVIADSIKSENRLYKKQLESGFKKTII